MRTFQFQILGTGRVTIPDSFLSELRGEARIEPGDLGGDKFLHRLHNEFPEGEKDDEFLAAALKNMLRNVFRAGFGTDLSKMGEGVGMRLAPATVQVVIPERVQRQIEVQQVSYGGVLNYHKQAEASDAAMRDLVHTLPETDGCTYRDESGACNECASIGQSEPCAYPEAKVEGRPLRGLDSPDRRPYRSFP